MICCAWHNLLRYQDPFVVLCLQLACIVLHGAGPRWVTDVHWCAGTPTSPVHCGLRTSWQTRPHSRLVFGAGSVKLMLLIHAGTSQVSLTEKIGPDSSTPILICMPLQALNDSMFGNTECYEGEGLEEDDEYAPDSKRRQQHSDSK